MDNLTFWQLYGEASKTAVGFFWKAGWAFVFGYLVSAMIQVFVPKRRLSRHMGEANLKSIPLATIFGAASSSCSFAALAAARALVQKGAHFIVAVAFMFASTNLVIELGVLIVIFLGWSYLVAELAGGIVLIVISTLLMRLTLPPAWADAARKNVAAASGEEEGFDWRRRIRSMEGWQMVAEKFGSDWQMVWQEILIGFTVAGFVAVWVPASFWATIFLAHGTHALPAWLVTLENALVAPLVAAATFIGSMGNIPVATVLDANGVLFAGIIGFIYSDLMVPPLVKVNSKYYGARMALYIAAVMYVSIVLTALLLDGMFALSGVAVQSRRVVADITQFDVDYTFWLNLAALVVTAGTLLLRKRHRKTQQSAHGGRGHHMDHGGKVGIKEVITGFFAVIAAGGLVSFWLTG